jgi:predicted membrane GTPase involved in stress response
MGGGLQGCLDELVDDVLGRGSVGVAHAEVDDVFAVTAGGHLHLAGDVEDVRREALDAAELFHPTILGQRGDRGAAELCKTACPRSHYCALACPVKVNSAQFSCA